VVRFGIGRLDCAQAAPEIDTEWSSFCVTLPAMKSTNSMRTAEPLQTDTDNAAGGRGAYLCVLKCVFV